MKMATVYGAEIGIGMADLAGALLLTQIVGVPFSFLFGWLAPRLGTKRSIYLGLAVYALISIAGYFMTHAWHFWVLAGMVGPFLFGVAGALAGSSRIAIVSLVIFFVVGGLLLSRVDEKEGIAMAQAENQAAGT